MSLELESILAARARLKPHIHHTPLTESAQLSRHFKIPVFLKLENWQRTGSFKIRGAFNKMMALSDADRGKGVVTASAGNHALGVAQAAQVLGIRSTVFVPKNASEAKVSALQGYDLTLVQKGADYDESEALAYRFQQEEGLIFIHAFSDPAIIAGQGTAGLEILEDLPDVETIIVPIGGGGLISGVAIAVKSQHPGVRVVGVQSEASPAMYNALRAGKVVETPIATTLADGLAGRFVTDLTFGFVKKYVDEVVLVSEPAIKRSMHLVFEAEHMVVEGSAVVGVSALLEGAVGATGKTAIILTGRNVAMETVRQVFKDDAC